MNARDIMTTAIVSVAPDTTVERAIEIMLEKRLSGLPVVDAGGALAGILTEGDLLRRSELGTQPAPKGWLRLFLAPGRVAEEYARTRGLRVADVMRAEVHTAPATAELGEIVDLMTRHRIKRVPIVERGSVVGMVARYDILRALAKSLNANAGARPLDDAGIAAAIREAFERSGCILKSLVDVAVKDGEVRLSGCVLDERERAAIHVAVESVPGVKSVHDHLAWLEPVSGTILPSPEDNAAMDKAANAA
jgi:CBS domain-containing protein